MPIAQEIVHHLRAAWARAYVRVVGANREPSWLFFEVMMPVGSIIAYVFLYRALGAPEEFVGFVVLGGAMVAYWMNVLWNMASQLFWEKQSGNLEAYLVSPVSLMTIMLGAAFGGMVASTLRAAAVVAIGAWFFDVQFTVHNPWGLLLTFGLTMAALYGMGLLLSSLFLLYGREAWHLSNMLQEPIYLVSGFYFPVRALGFWVALAASFIPLTMGLDAMRQLIYGPKALGLISVVWEIGVLAALAVTFLAAARWALRFMEGLAKREGRLTLRWQ